MARVQFGSGVTSIVGSIGGNTFQSNRSGYIIRSRGFTRKQVTPKQVTAMNAYQYYLYLWSLLTLVEKQSWDTLALAHTKTDKFGQIKTLSGFNWFVSVNYMQVLCGFSPLNTAPVYAAPSSVPNYTVNASITKLQLIIDTPQTITDNFAIIRATPPINKTTTSFQKQLKFISVIQSDYWDNVDITSDWENATGYSWPPSFDVNKFQIGIMIQSVNINSGVTSEGSRFISSMLEGIGYMEIGASFQVH